MAQAHNVTIYMHAEELIGEKELRCYRAQCITIAGQ